MKFFVLSKLCLFAMLLGAAPGIAQDNPKQPESKAPEPAAAPAEIQRADPATLLSQGIQAYAAEKYDEAIELFEKLVQFAPNSAENHDWLGKAYGRKAEHVIFFRAMGLARKARNEFQKAVDLDGSYVQGLSDLLDYCLEAPGFLGGGLDRAKVVASQLAKVSAAEGHRAEALIRVKEKDYAGAQKEFQEALNAAPGRLGRLLDMAAFLNERGNYAEADAVFERAEKMAPESSDYLFVRGQQLVNSKRDPERARELLKAYLRSGRKPDDPTPSEVENLLKKLP